MSNTQLKDGNGSLKYFRTNGTGTDLDPIIPVQDVNSIKSTTKQIIAKFSKEVANTTLAIALPLPSAGITYDIVVTDATGFIVGQYLSIFSIVANRFFLANVAVINGTTITVDTPLDFEYPAGSFVTVGDTDMAIDATVPTIYGLRNTDQAIGKTFNITRLMFKCLTDDPTILSKFGDIVGGLNKGLVVRKRDGIYQSLFNVKTNGDLKLLAYDFDAEVASQQGQDGFTTRFTIEKLGSVVELAPGEDIEVILQDAELLQLQLFEIMAEGYEVD